MIVEPMLYILYETMTSTFPSTLDYRLAITVNHFASLFSGIVLAASVVHASWTEEKVLTVYNQTEWRASSTTPTQAPP